jgi:hypothetical protein
MRRLLAQMQIKATGFERIPDVFRQRLQKCNLAHAPAMRLLTAGTQRSGQPAIAYQRHGNKSAHIKGLIDRSLKWRGQRVDAGGADAKHPTFFQGVDKTGGISRKRIGSGSGAQPLWIPIIGIDDEAPVDFVHLGKGAPVEIKIATYSLRALKQERIGVRREPHLA